MPDDLNGLQAANRDYWDALTPDYQEQNRIRCDRFHVGPLLPGGEALGLLPENLDGQRCLEVGAGAGQNSICLARQGALCTATDISAAQLERGRELACQHGVEVDWRELPMEQLDQLPAASFDFVHSVYALPFTHDPEAVLVQMARLLRPGGQLLLVTGHPVFAGEWLEIEGEGEGMFLPDYFEPPPDVRSLTAEDDDDTLIFSRTWPLSDLFGWLQGAGLRVERLLEPRPLPIPAMSEQEIAEQVPYDSDLWRPLYPQIANVPVVVIFQALCPVEP